MPHIQPDIHLPKTPRIKWYAALLTQLGTSAPTAIILRNNLGLTIAWTRTDVGDYKGTPSSSIDMEKSTIICNGGLLGSWNFNIRFVSPTEIQLQTAINGVLNDELLLKTYVQINIYTT